MGIKLKRLTITRDAKQARSRERDRKEIESDSPLCTGSVTLLRGIDSVK